MSTEPSGDEPQPSGGSIGPTSPGWLVGWAAAGLVGGWLLHPLTDRVLGSAPVVTWTQVLAVVILALLLGAAAVGTWREVQVRRRRLEPHRAVNRLLLARASALVGALVAGGYAGYAISWLGVDAHLADQRVLRSAAGALGGVAMTIASLGLERACRVPSDDEGP